MVVVLLDLLAKKRIIFSVMKILGGGNLKRPRSLALCFLRRMDCLTRSEHQKNQRQHKNQRNLKMKFVLLQKKKVCKSQK
nr:hypothetical protein Iba_chr08aCG0720 [Ipomoea batatas]